MKLLLIGERFSPNLGDPIICESLAYLIKQEFPAAQIYFLDLSARQDYPSDQASPSALIKSRFSAYIKQLSLALTKLNIDSEYLLYQRMHQDKDVYYQAIIDQADFDLAIFAGGQMFLDYFVFPIHKVVSYLKAKNIPILFNACGSGQIASKRMRKLLQDSLSFANVRSVSSRDDLLSLQGLVKQESVLATYDPALWAKEVYQVDRQASDLIGLGVLYSHNMNYKAMLSFWIKIIEDLQAAGYKWQLFTNGAPNDQAFAKAILGKLGYREKDFANYLLPRPQRPQDLVKTIAGFKGIISFRLHSHVLAASLQVPSIALVWDQKIRYFFGQLNLSQRVFELEAESSEIIQALESAFKTGYDKELLEKQKSHLKEVLLANLDKESKHV